MSGCSCFSCSDAHGFDQLFDHGPNVADDRHVGAANLAELGGIDVDVNDLRVRRERRDLAGDAIVEARSQGDQQIGLLHRRDGGVVAVHARHAEAQRVLVGDAAASHQRRDDRNAGHFGEFAQLTRRARLEDAAARVDHRLPRRLDQTRRILDLLRVTLHVRLVAGQVDLLGPVPVHRRVRDVLRQVDEHRTGPSRRRDVERFPHDPRDVLRVADQPVVLRDGHRDADGVGLLERVGADHGVGNLSGDDDDRHRVHVRVAQRRDDDHPEIVPSLVDRIKQTLVALKMPRAIEILDFILRRLEHGEINAIEAIDTLLAEELTLRENRRIKIALVMARLSSIKTLAGFDFSFQPSLDKNRIMALAELEFIDRSEVVHFLGPPGTGKSHLSLALASKPSRPAAVSTSRHSVISSARSPRPSARAPFATRSGSFAASRCLSSTKSVTCPSLPAAAICSSSSSMHDTKKAP